MIYVLIYMLLGTITAFLITAGSEYILGYENSLDLMRAVNGNIHTDDQADYMLEKVEVAALYLWPFMWVVFVYSLIYWFKNRK